MTRAQVLEIGLGDSGITGRVRNGSFVTRYPGVYALAPLRADPPALAFAAVLACGPHAVLSHQSAAYLWGFVRSWEAPRTSASPRAIAGHATSSPIDARH